MEIPIYTFKNKLKLFSSELRETFKCSPVENIKNVLSKHELSEVKDSNGATLLHLAACYNRDELVTFLTERGCCINAQNDAGETPLFCAVRESWIVVTMDLLDAGADPFLADNEGMNPLKLAVSEDDILYSNIRNVLINSPSINRIRLDSIAKILIDTGYTLRHVVYSQNLKITKAFINSGCDINAANQQDGVTALHIAVNQYNVDLVKLLIEHGGDVNAKNIMGRKPIHFISLIECKEILRILLDAGTGIYECDQRGNMPLWRAMRNGCKRVIEVILECNFDLMRKDANGANMLHYVVQNRNEGVAELFLTYKLDLNFKDEGLGETFLHKAMRHGNLQFLRVLLTLGADVNCKNIHGCTPLFLIAQEEVALWEIRGHHIELLLAYGANINEKYHGSCIIEEALHLGYFGLVKPLIKHVSYLQAHNQPVIEENLLAIETHTRAKMYLETITAKRWKDSWDPAEYFMYNFIPWMISLKNN